MPKQMYSEELVVGYILAQNDQLRDIIQRLENQEHYTMRELGNLHDQIDGIRKAVNQQLPMANKVNINPILATFNELYRRAMQTRERRVQRLRANAQASMLPESEIHFGTVDPEMVNALSVSVGELQPYTSDNEEPLPLECMSIVRPGNDFEPISFRPNENDEPIASTSRQADLREQLNDWKTRASSGSHRSVKRQNRDGNRSQQDRTEEQDRRSRAEVQARNNARQMQVRNVEQGRGHRAQVQVRHNGSRREYERSRSNIRGQIDAASAMMTRERYIPMPQRPLGGPVTNSRPFPPILRRPPTPLVRRDPSLIGSSEVFVHPPQADPKICPICPGGRHKLYHCTTFQRMGLQERWYTALKKGVCLHCLIRGHSHFTCKTAGTCQRCGKRHNSKLCPDGPHNG